MKIFTTQQISKIDKYTIENEPIKSIDLMERASLQLSNYVIKHFSRHQAFAIFCGFGNNGGDGLALARILHLHGFSVRVFLFAPKGKQSPDNVTNFKRCQELDIPIKKIRTTKDIEIKPEEIIIDALFGSGLNRPLEGKIISIINKLNKIGNKIISIDVPSGLMGEDNRFNNPNNIIRANLTLTLEFPKLAFFFPENETFVGKFIIIPIGLHPEAKKAETSPYFYNEKNDISTLLMPRSTFTEKRQLGHGLLYACYYNKMGAAILASRAALRSGLGLLTTWVPSEACSIIQTAVPEAMTKTYTDNEVFSYSNFKFFNAIAIGCAIGITPSSKNKLKSILKEAQQPLIIDADGISLLSENKSFLHQLPHNTIITPHVREFDRLFGEHKNHFERFLTARTMAKKHHIIIILKGAYTQIHSPQGITYFNSTGNPGMATGGSGDVLTGILLGLLAQNYSPLDAALIGTYIHGLAGNLALEKQSHESLIASDIIEHLGKAFQSLHNFN